MGLDGKILRRAMDRLEAEGRQRSERTRRLRQQLYLRDPRLQELDGLLRSTVAEAAALALRHGDDPEQAIHAVQQRNLAYQEERAGRIAALGQPADCLDEAPACPACGDRGFVLGKPCPSCLLPIYREEQRRELSRMLNLQGECFSAFRLQYYDDTPDGSTGVSPRQHMEFVYQVCRRYAETFHNGSDNLFLTGAPGLGKTFLSSSIAGVVAARGYSVVYDTAVSLAAHFEEARFSRGERQEEAEAEIQRYLRCDLLILDDLGAEMATALTVSAIYEVLNTRLRERRSMVVSSNLSIQEAGKRYSPQIASRLGGGFEELRFYGRDIRQQKRML